MKSICPYWNVRTISIFWKLLKKTCHLWSRQGLSIPCVLPWRLSNRQYFWHVMYLFLVCKNKTEWGKTIWQFVKLLLHTLFWKYKGIFFLYKCFTRHCKKKESFRSKRAFEMGVYFFTVLNFKGYHSWYILWWCFLWTLEDCKHKHIHNFKSVYDMKFFTLSSPPHPFAYGLIKGKTLVKVNIKM